MSYYTRISGDVWIPPENIKAACRALEKNEEWDEGNKIPKSRAGLIKALNSMFEEDAENFTFTAKVEGKGILIAPDDETSRDLNEISWVFDALAPFVLPCPSCNKGVSKEAILWFTGEDEDYWRWRFSNGKVIEEGSDIVYGDDIKSPEAIRAVVDLVYPDGRPASSLTGVNYEELVQRIENVIRDNGFGPQAGKTELERLADVTQ